MTDADERFRRGLEAQARLDPDISDKLIDGLADIAPDLARYTVEFPYGDIYSRPGLDLRTRQVATIAALVALGAPGQLKTHIGFALNVGLTRDEIVEIVMQMAVYAGWPRCLEAIAVAREAFAAHEDVPPEG